MKKNHLLRLALSIKTFLLFIFISAIHFTGIAQQDKTTDSLLNVLKTQKEDTNRVNTLNSLSRRFLDKREFELSNKYAKDAIVLAEKLDFKKGFRFSYSYLGTNNYQLGNYKEAIENYRIMMKFAEEIGDKTGVGNAYMNIGNVYSVQRNYKEAIENYRSMMKFREETGDKTGVGRAYTLIGSSYFNQGGRDNTTEALKYYLTSAKLFEEAGDKRLLAGAYYNIGNSHYSLSNFTEAIKAQKISLGLFKEIDDKLNIAARYIDIGNYYDALGNYLEALENFLASLKISEELGLKRQIGAAYNNIGNVYNTQGNYPEAKKNYLAGLKKFEEINDSINIQNSYNNLGSIYQHEGNYAEAMKNHLAALTISKKFGYAYGGASSYQDIGSTYFLQNNYRDALKNYQASLEVWKIMGSKDGIASIYKDIGEAYFNLNEYPEARQYFNDALSIAREIQAKATIEECYQSLARLDSASGNWEGALINHKLSLLYRDSLLNEESSNKITEMRMQFEFDKKEDSLKYQQALTDEKLKQQQLLASQQSQSLLLKENEVELLNNEKLLLNKEKEFQDLQLQNNASELAVQKAESEKKQNQVLILNKEYDIQTLQIKKQKQFRNYLLIGIGLLITIAAFGYFNYRTRQQLKLQKLRNKIASDLHDDVGSTLSSISMFSQMAQQQSKETIPLLDSIGDYSRKMLDAMADIVWTINPENDQFEQIILRMRNFAYDLLGTKNIEFEFDANEDVTNMKLSMDVRKNIYLIFKEATNNMAKYSGADQALFSIKNEKNNLIMLIHDNGKGFDKSQASSGNGLKNMRKRAEEIGADLMINSVPGNGTTIELKIAV